MAATGKEVPTLDQLLMYVPYITDEELTSYLTYEEFTGGEFEITSQNYELNFGNTTCQVTDDGKVTLSPIFWTNTWRGMTLSSGVSLFSVPEKYAPSKAISGTISLNNVSHHIEITAQGVCSYADTESVQLDWNEQWTVNLSYTLDVEPPTATGKEVIRLSQLKQHLAGNGGGNGGSSASWKTAWSGTFMCSISNWLSISTSSFGYGTTSKMRVTASYSIYGQVQDSGTYEITVPSSLPSSAGIAQQIGEFIIDTQRFYVGAYCNNGNVYLKFVCENTSFTQYCAITKIEVM